MLLHDGFEAMVAEVTAGLAERGHPDVTATLEFALQAIDGGIDTASALGREFGISKQAATKTIAALEGLGYLSRASDSADARRKSLTVTARGREMVELGAALFDELYDRWSERVGPRGLQQTTRTLARLLER